MDRKAQYKKRKKELLLDTNINKENKDLFKKFFEYEEYKLARINNLSQLDDRCYKTLLLYVYYCKTANQFFKNKAWTSLTEKDIKKVYDALETGKIKTRQGKQIKDRASFYKKVFRSKLFELAGKKELASKVMQFYKPREDKEVRFLDEDSFRKAESVVINIYHKTFLWLAWDIGENVSTILELQKKDCRRQINPYTKESEYIINLPKEKLKRSRTARSEPTNYQESVKLLDIILEGLKDEDYLFDFGHKMALKFFNRAIKITNIKVQPHGDKPTLKDLRSGMACNLLKKGWNRDEVNARLGHKPSSSEIDKYINFLALDRHIPKKKIYDSNISKLQGDLEEVKEREKNQIMKIEKIKLITEELKPIAEEFREKFIKLYEREKEIFEFMKEQEKYNQQVNKLFELNNPKIKQQAQEIYSEIIKKLGDSPSIKINKKLSEEKALNKPHKA